MTLGSIEYDQEPWETEGELYTEQSPLGLQCFVGGEAVESATVRLAESPDATETPLAVPTANVDVQSDPGIEDGLPAL